MSEVRMSLAEYNEMKEILDRHIRILHAILAPTPISQWDIDWHNDHPGHVMYTSSSPMENLSFEDKEYLKSIIYSNANVLNEEQFASKDMDVMFELNTSFQLGYFKDVEEPKMSEEVE